MMDEEKARVRKGYERIRGTIKNLRQDYRATINRGPRSGSGKLIQDNFDLLTEIWGGSPATTSPPFEVDGILRIQRLKVNISYGFYLSFAI